jgi:hypothetical protein
MKNKILIALTLTLITGSIHAAITLTKARTFVQTIRANKIKTASVVLGCWLLADIGGHAAYNKIAKKIKAMQLNTAERGVKQAEDGLKFAQTQAKMSADLQEDEEDPIAPGRTRRRALLAEFDAACLAAAPARIAAAKTKRDTIKQEYETMLPKRSYTERFVRFFITPKKVSI